MLPIALGRKNWLHIGSEEAAPKIAAILSVSRPANATASTCETNSMISCPSSRLGTSTESPNFPPSRGGNPPALRPFIRKT